MGEVIGILSLKGGVGKTSVAVALGAAMADFGKKVLLIDGNFSAPNLGLHLKLINPEVTIHHILEGKKNIKSAIHSLGKFDVIPASFSEKIQINPLKLKDKIKLLKREYDFIIIDSSPSLNDETLAVMLASDKLIVVATPDYPTLKITMKAVEMAKERDAPIIGLVINKAYNKKFELSMKDIEKRAGVPILAVIPHDINVVRALSEFSPSTTYKPKSEASIEYRKLAAALIGEKYKPFKFRYIFRRGPRKQDVNREIYYERMFR